MTIHEMVSCLKYEGPASAGPSKITSFGYKHIVLECYHDRQDIMIDRTS